MKATVLVDNLSQGKIRGEWGLSIHIEYEGRQILLDAGASGLFYKNAQKLNLDIKNVDYAVLSHAHYDHANGMETFFEQNDKANFYLQKGSEENCYIKKWIFHKYVGLPKEIIENYKERIMWAEGDYQLCPGVSIIPHKTADLAQIGAKNSMYIRSKYGWKADDFSHEQSLVFETKEGLVIFNSCSHGGPDNIIDEVKRTYPGQEIRAMIGGFHICGKSKKEVQALAKRLKETGVKEIYTGHCTGKRAYRILKEELGACVHQLKVGKIIEI